MAILSLGEVEGPLPAWAAPLLALAYVAGGFGLARAQAVLWRRVNRREDRDWASPRPRRRWMGLLALGVQLYLLAGLVGLLLLGWGGWVRHVLHLDSIPLVPEVVAALPFVAALLAYWHQLYPLDKVLRAGIGAFEPAADAPPAPTWTRRQYIGFNVRHNLLFVAAPAAMLILAADLINRLGHVLPSAVLAGAALALSGAVFLAAPLLIVRMWKTVPLPEGDLRRALEAMCRAMRIRFREMMLWRTGGVIANAAVLGLVGKTRYVLLTDALVDNLSQAELEAVFAHEAGHVVHHHILYMVVMTVGLSMLLSAAGEAAEHAGLLASGWSDYVMLGAMATAWLPAFGYLSRRLEWQADAFAAAWMSRRLGGSGPGLTLEGVCVFNQALSAVARLNGISVWHGNFRHGSIRHRRDRLMDLLMGDENLADSTARLKHLQRGCWLLLLAGAAATAAVVGWAYGPPSLP